MIICLRIYASSSIYISYRVFVVLGFSSQWITEMIHSYQVLFPWWSDMVPWTQFRWGECWLIDFRMDTFIEVIRWSRVKRRSFFRFHPSSRLCWTIGRSDWRHPFCPAMHSWKAATTFLSRFAQLMFKRHWCQDMIRQQARPFPAGVASLVFGEVQFMHLTWRNDRRFSIWEDRPRAPRA